MFHEESSSAIYEEDENEGKCLSIYNHPHEIWQLSPLLVITIANPPSKVYLHIYLFSTILGIA